MSMEGADSQISYQKIVDETAFFLSHQLANVPEIMLIMGTGQENTPDSLKIEHEIPYSRIPNFPKATVTGHKGCLLSGKLAGRHIAILQGRFHYYEGYNLQQITLPVRAMAVMGCRILLICNCAGGLNPRFSPGSLMIVTDHLNFIGQNPLRGANHDDWGPRFPDMSSVYSERIINKAQTCARRLKLPNLVKGIYVAIPGPSLETPAETRYLRNCGADAVGMSTVPEVIVAKHAGMEVFALSIIANVNNPDNFQPIVLEEVIAGVKKAETEFLRLLEAIVDDL